MPESNVIDFKAAHAKRATVAQPSNDPLEAYLQAFVAAIDEVPINFDLAREVAKIYPPSAPSA